MSALVALHHNSGSFVSWGIALFTRSKYTHADLWFPVQQVVVSADAEGVVAKPVPRTADHGNPRKAREVDLFYHVPLLSEEQVAMLYDNAMSLVGKTYDYIMTFAGFPMRLIEPKSSREKYFCSELVFQVFRLSGIELLKRSAPYKLSPRDLSLSPLLRFKRKVFVV